MNSNRMYQTIQEGQAAHDDRATTQQLENCYY